MTSSNVRNEDSSPSWKSWYATKGIEVDEDIPMLAEKLKKRGMSRILDLGCGTGRHTIYFADMRFEVYGLDSSEYAIERAREILKEKQLRADLKISDMANPLPYADGFFDALISVLALHHFEIATIKKIVAEVERVTREGGFLYVQVPRLEYWFERIKEGRKMNEIEPGTFLQMEGGQKGVLHHGFSLEELTTLFNSYIIESITSRRHFYAFLAVKK